MFTYIQIMIFFIIPIDALTQQNLVPNGSFNATPDGNWGLDSSPPNTMWASNVSAPDGSNYVLLCYFKHNGLGGEEEIENNGMDVGEMNKILMEKVEELTLLMIEQQEEIKELQEKVK